MRSPSDPDELAAALLERCTFEGPAVSCAVSGGADSLALLILSCAAGLDVTALHVDHGLRPGSAREADVVARVAERLGARFVPLTVDVEPGPNLEARARAARYDALPAGVLTGHTADDQAETILLALLRGSAWRGLGGMVPSPQRPLLGLRRRDTEALCDAYAIAVVNDPSNRDPTHRRNRVRHELLPLMNDIADRDVVPILARTSQLLRSGAGVIEGAAAPLDPTDGRALTAAPEIVAREAVRRWLWRERGDDHPPDLATVDRVLQVARHEALAAEVGGGWRVARTGGILRLEPPGLG